MILIFDSLKMKKYTISHERLAIKITFFWTVFVTIFFTFFLLFSFLYLLDTESKELKNISQLNFWINPTWLVVVSWWWLITNSTSLTTEFILWSWKKQMEWEMDSVYGSSWVVAISATLPQIPPWSDTSPIHIEWQRVFELTRDSLVQTKDGNIIKNGIFSYDIFDMPSLLEEEKDIFTRKTGQEYYLLYKIVSEWNTYLFAQNVSYIYFFMYTSVCICIVSTLLFSFCLFYFSRYLIQLFMKPIEENNTRLKEYNHNLAHEIKTPLTVMTLNLGALENDENQELIESTREEVFKIKNITDTLLFLSENFVVKQKELVWIISLIEAFIQKYPNKEVIEFIHKGIDMKVSIDVNIFERLLKNLIENALKYSSDWRVCITLQKDTIFFTNKVAKNIDTSKLLDMFFQGDNSRNSQGYGLWLTLVKRIIEILGWQIQLSCERKKFTVEIILR